MTNYTSGVFPAIELDPNNYGTAWTLDSSRSGHVTLKTSAHGKVTPSNSTYAGGIKNPLTNAWIVAPTDSTLPSAVALIRVSPIMPTPSLTYKGRPNPSVFIPSSTVTEVVGWYQIVIGGKDVSFFRNSRPIVNSIIDAEPFGSISASIVFPQITIFEDFSVANGLEWLKNNPDIEIYLVDQNGSRLETLFEGFITEPAVIADSSNVNLTITALGALFESDYWLAQPKLNNATKTVENHIAERLNSVHRKRFASFNPNLTSTGITLVHYGAWEKVLTGFVQELLAHTTSDDGMNQWTLTLNPGRLPTLKLKDRTTVNWTITPGTPGIEIDVKKDLMGAPTTIYGRGTSVDESAKSYAMRGYGNLKLPGFLPEGNSYFGFCFSNPALYLSLGSTDSSTTSRDGVTTVQRRLNQIGNRVFVSGTYDAKTVLAVKNYQTRAGLTIDGLVGAQTWTSLFGIGTNSAAWDAAYYAPFASLSAVEPYLYYGDGSTIPGTAGINANYDKTRLRNEIHLTFQEGTSKSDAFKVSNAILNRDSNPYWQGKITLNIDPQEGSRWRIKSGQNIKIKSLQGSDQLFHINSVDKDEESLSVTLTVDAGARDYMTLDAIAQRKRDAWTPAKRSTTRYKETAMATSQPIIDSELSGWISKHTCQKGMWTVVQIPLASTGTIVGIELDAYSLPNSKSAQAATAFVQAYFAGPITAAQLNSLIGDPTLYRADGLNTTAPFTAPKAVSDQLVSLGWIDTLGMPGQKAGYYPYKDNSSNGIDTPTGIEKVYNLSKQFESFQPPYIWVATWMCRSAAYMQGRIYIAPTA
jgi:hypothetical protein